MESSASSWLRMAETFLSRYLVHRSPMQGMQILLPHLHFSCSYNIMRIFKEGVHSSAGSK